METLARQGSFAPRELPRFIATMAPSDSRPCPATVIDFRRQSLGPHAMRSSHTVGSLRFLADLSTPAVPSTPGSPSVALARCFTDGVRFRHLRKVDRYRFA